MWDRNFTFRHCLPPPHRLLTRIIPSPLDSLKWHEDLTVPGRRQASFRRNVENRQCRKLTFRGHYTHEKAEAPCFTQLPGRAHYEMLGSCAAKAVVKAWGGGSGGGEPGAAKP